MDRSIVAFGAYLTLAGVSFFAVPNLILPILGLATTSEPWIRIVGLLTAILGFYFLNAARENDTRFFGATITARLVFFAGVTLLALLKLASPILVGFGLIDLAGAAWTWRTLRAAAA